MRPPSCRSPSPEGYVKPPETLSANGTRRSTPGGGAGSDAPAPARIERDRRAAGHGVRGPRAPVLVRVDSTAPGRARVPARRHAGAGGVGAHRPVDARRHERDGHLSTSDPRVPSQSATNDWLVTHRVGNARPEAGVVLQGLDEASGRQWTRFGGPEHGRGDLHPSDRGQDHQELHRGREGDGAAAQIEIRSTIFRVTLRRRRS